MAISKKLNFATVRKVMDKIDDNGKYGRCGNWVMGLGGYDHGYGTYFKGQEIGRVNYGDKKYELYDEDFISKEQIPEFLKAVDAVGFKNINEKDMGKYEEGDWVKWQDQEWYIGDGWFDDEDRCYFYTLKQLNGHTIDAVPEEDLTPLDDEQSSNTVNESISLKDVTKRYSAKQRTALDGKSWWVAFDNKTGKYIPGNRYKAKRDCETGIIFDMKYGRLDATSDELDSIEAAFGGMRTESTRKQKMKFRKFVKEGTSDVKNLINDYGDSCIQYGKSGDRIDKIWMQRQLDKVYRALARYGESTKKVVKEADEGDNHDGDTPKIYVGTYAKYNDGSIDGKWIDLTKYNTYEDFVQACQELHADEEDPEFMVQDYENFPEKWYHEGGLPTEEEFNKINEYYMMDDDHKEAYEAFVNHTGLVSMEDFEDAYVGKFDSAEDFAYSMIEDLGWDGIGSENLEMYFDYDSFGRDLMYDFHRGDEDNTDSEGEPEDPEHYYDNDGYDQGEYESNRQVGEDYVDNLGGVDQLGDNAQNYFDYEAFGRDLFISDYFEEDGYVFRRI